MGHRAGVVGVRQVFALALPQVGLADFTRSLRACLASAAEVLAGRQKGYRDDQIHLLGNVTVDTLLANLDPARQRPVLEELGLVAGEYGLVTVHRPANVGDPAMLDVLLGALETVGRDLPLVFPVHPRARALESLRRSSNTTEDVSMHACARR